MQVLSKDEFEYFRSKIFMLAGISLPDSKYDLVQTRLNSMLFNSGFRAFQEYKLYLESLPPQHEEWQAFTNLLTTNKTDWFREKKHFDYIVEEFLPKWKRLGKKHLDVWCAACSTGEEPYTLAMVLFEELTNKGLTFQIRASDIDTSVLSVAQNGVYPLSRLDQVPEEYRHCFVIGTKEISNWMKVRKEIKKNVQFRQVNLTNIPSDWPRNFDLILCRNVIIYFNTETIEQVVNSIYERTGEDSILLIAHAESLQNMKTSWRYLRPSVYAKGRVF